MNLKNKNIHKKKSGNALLAGAEVRFLARQQPCKGDSFNWLLAAICEITRANCEPPCEAWHQRYQSANFAKPKLSPLPINVFHFSLVKTCSVRVCVCVTLWHCAHIQSVFKCVIHLRVRIFTFMSVTRE